jgi:hypothetical protein
VDADYRVRLGIEAGRAAEHIHADGVFRNGLVLMPPKVQKQVPQHRRFAEWQSSREFFNWKVGCLAHGTLLILSPKASPIEVPLSALLLVPT